MGLTVKDKELLRDATLKPNEWVKLHEMEINVIYTSYYPAWVLCVLQELKKDFPKRKFRIRYQIVEIKEKRRLKL